MRIWDVSGQLLKAYRLKPVIDSVTIASEESVNLLGTVPVVGSFIQVIVFVI
jgi:hypothetical protein